MWLAIIGDRDYWSYPSGRSLRLYIDGCVVDSGTGLMGPCTKCFQDAFPPASIALSVLFLIAFHSSLALMGVWSCFPAPRPLVFLGLFPDHVASEIFWVLNKNAGMWFNGWLRFQYLWVRCRWEGNFIHLDLNGYWRQLSRFLRDLFQWKWDIHEDVIRNLCLFPVTSI